MFRSAAGLGACNDAIGFGFNQPVWVDKAFDFNEGAGGSDVSKEFAMRFSSIFPRADVGEHDPRSDDVLQ